MHFLEQITSIYNMGFPDTPKTDCTEHVTETYKKQLNELIHISYKLYNDMIKYYNIPDPYIGYGEDWYKDFFKRDYMSNKYKFNHFIVSALIVSAYYESHIIEEKHNNYMKYNIMHNFVYDSIKKIDMGNLDTLEFTYEDFLNGVIGYSNRDLYSLDTQCSDCGNYYVSSFVYQNGTLYIKDVQSTKNLSTVNMGAILCLYDELKHDMSDEEYKIAQDKINRYHKKGQDELTNSLSIPATKCQYESNKSFELSIIVNKGDQLVFADSLGSGYLEKKYNLPDRNINKQIENDNMSLDLIQHGLVRIFVGNTCPSIIKTEDNKFYVRRLDGSDYDEKNEDFDDDYLKDGEERVDSVCTDLWNVQAAAKSMMIKEGLYDTYTPEFEFPPESEDSLYVFKVHRYDTDEYKTHAYATFTRYPVLRRTVKRTAPPVRKRK